MLYRKAYDKLKMWKQQKSRTALCIQGARQIGKTTVVREFGKNEYKCFLEFNFVSDTDARRVFDGNLDANTIIEGLSALARKPLIPGNTLILFDEIQECLMPELQSSSWLRMDDLTILRRVHFWV